MQTITASRVIDLTDRFQYLRRDRRRARLHTVLAVWTQYGSIAALATYGLLRIFLRVGAGVGRYSCPLDLLWPLSFLLLLTSYVSDILLWQEEW